MAMDGRIQSMTSLMMTLNIQTKTVTDSVIMQLETMLASTKNGRHVDATQPKDSNSWGALRRIELIKRKSDANKA